MKLALRILAIAALTLLLVGAWVAAMGGRNADWAGLLATLRSSSPALVALAALLQLAALAVRAERWRALLSAAARGEHGGFELPARRPLVVATGIGFAVTFTLPGRLGELVRPALLSARTRVPFPAALASVVLERVLDVGALVVLLLGYLALSPGPAPPGLARGALVAALAWTCAVGAVIAVQSLRPGWPPAALAAVTAPLPRRGRDAARRLGLSFLAGFDALRAPGAWWRLGGWSLLTWLPSVAGLAAALAATGPSVALTDGLLLVPLTALGIALPTPAGVGGYHALLTWGLADVLGWPASRAGAAAIVAHLTCVVPVVLAGLYLLVSEGLSVGALRGTVARAGAEGPLDESRETTR